MGSSTDPSTAWWGFHPLPFRIAALVLLVVNFALLAVVVRQLTGSRWAVLMALLAVGINPSFAAEYFDTGAIYDTLAFTFFWGGFALYVRLRRGGRPLGWGGIATVLFLFAAALNAKEISVSLPAAVALYELVWHPPANWKPPELIRWVCHQGRFACIGGLLDIAYLIGKRYGADSLWRLEGYRPSYSAGAYFQSLSHYLGQLLYKPVPISSWQIAGLLIAMLALAALTRRRCLLWSVGFIAVGVLPLAFIPWRGGFAYLAPSVGWAVFAGGLLDWLLKRAAGRRLRVLFGAQAALFAAAFVLLAPWQRTWIEMHARAAHQAQERYRGYIGQIHALIPAPRRGARILLLADGGAPGNLDDLCFAMRLSYQDPRLEVERMTVRKGSRGNVNPSRYDYILDWTDKRLDDPGSYSGLVERAPPLARSGVYDDDNPALVFDGPWIQSQSWAQAMSHTITYADLPGSDVRFAFEGELLTYVYTKAPNRGKAGVTIDGVSQAALDLYSPETQWQSRSVFKLDRGRHLAVITILPANNPRSAGRFVDVDGFEVK